MNNVYRAPEGFTISSPLGRRHLGLPWMTIKLEVIDPCHSISCKHGYIKAKFRSPIFSLDVFPVFFVDSVLTTLVFKDTSDPAATLGFLLFDRCMASLSNLIELL